MREIILTIVVALLSGGLAGASVSWWTSKQDRELVAIPTLQLERDRFEHERTSDEKAKEEAAYSEMNDALSDCFEYLNTAFHTDTSVGIKDAFHRLSANLNRVYLKAALAADQWVMWYARDAANAMQAAMAEALDGGDPQPMIEYLGRSARVMNDFQSDALKGKRYTFTKQGLVEHNKWLTQT